MNTKGCSDALGSEGRHLGALSQGSIPDRGCPLGSERLGSLDRTTSFRQLAHSAKSDSAGDQGGTTGGSRGRSGEGGNAKDGRSSSFTTISREREVVDFSLPLP